MATPFQALWPYLWPPERADLVLHGALHEPTQMAEELYIRLFESGSDYSI